MGDCLSQDMVDRYTAGTCSSEDRQRVEAHLKACQACRRRLQAGQPTLANPDSRLWIGSGSGPVPQASGFPCSEDLVGKPLEHLLENYQIIEELPRGGQAVVYKAIHKATKMKVALKVLLPSLLGSAKARQSFEREVELAASLSHPNIVRIHDSGITRGQYYFSMEYIHGQALDDYVAAKALGFREEVVLFCKVCDAMTCAHQHGVIHRDLKPSNILVDDRGEPHVVDFGLAKAAGPFGLTGDGVPIVSMTGEIKGTVSYMSPEQAEGRSDLVDVRTDVYSLGVILYQLLTARFPYDVSGPMLKVLETIRKTEPVRPRQIISRFDSDVEAVLLKCLTKAPSGRYQSAAELHHDLRCWLDGLPIVAKSVSSLYLLRKVVSRHQYTSLVVTLLVVTLISFCFVSFDLYKTARRARQETQQIADRWRDESTRQIRVNREVDFSVFLMAWHAGGSRMAQWAMNFMPESSEEKKTALFLLERNAASRKKEGVHPAEGPESTWLGDCAIGEDLLRKGHKQEAMEAYTRSYEALQRILPARWSSTERILAHYIEDRLRELNGKPTATGDQAPGGEP